MTTQQQADVPLATRLAALLLIRPGEGRRTLLLFAQLLLASAIFILGRTVRDTLFLSRYPVSALPWMFVLYGAASAVTVVVYARFADKLARHTMIGASALIGVVSYLAVWVAIRLGISLVYPAFYVWSEVFANLFIVQFWTLANDLHDARSSKRLFGVIAAARVLGVVVIGVTAGVLVRAIGTAQLLFLLAAMMVAVAALARALRHEPRPAAERPGSQRQTQPITRNRYVHVLALMILLCFMTLTVGDYQFKVIARSVYQEDALAQYFSLFYAATGIISLVFQIFVTPRLLSRFGVGWGMRVMPSVFGAASLALLVLPHLAVATVMKFADNGFQYTIHETTLQSLYVPFAPNTKARTRALLDAVIKPCSYGAGGLVLLLLAPRLSVSRLSLLTTALVLLWLLVVPLVKSHYLRSLQATLSAHGTLALEEAQIVLDAGARDAISELLRKGDRRQRLAALQQVDVRKMPDVIDILEQLTDNPHPEVRLLALRALKDAEQVRVEPLRACLNDEDARVRAEAVQRYAELVRDQSLEQLEPMFDDGARKVRVEALASVMHYGGVDGAVLAGSRLGALLEGPARARAEAALVLGHLGPSAFRPLLRLLADKKAKVRRAALRACAGVPDPRLVPALVKLFLDPACQADAGAGLIAIGEPAVDRLVELLKDPSTVRFARLRVPLALQRIVCQLSYEAMRDVGQLDDSLLRLRVYAALSRLRESLAVAAEPLERIIALVEMEIRDGVKALASWQILCEYCDGQLLTQLVQLRYQRASERVVRILELRYERAAVRLARHRMRSPQHRANALEVLDTIIEPRLRPLVMPFLDDSLPVKERIAAAGRLRAAPTDLDAQIKTTLGHASPYVVALLLDAMRRHPALIREDQIVACARHAAPLVRESALATLVSIESAQALAVAAQLVDDPDPVVRRIAHAIDRQDESFVMQTTIDKVLLLQSASLFSSVPGDDLLTLARVADEITVAAGETIFKTGDHGVDLYIIVSGSVRIRRGGEPIATLGPGETLGEMAVLDESPRSASAIAAEATILLRIGSEEFYECLHEQVEIAEGVIRMLTRRLREATKSMASGGSLSELSSRESHY